MSQAERYQMTHPDEMILLVTRRHWWAWVRWFPVPLALMLLCFGLAALLPPIAGVFVLIGLVFPAMLALYFYAEWSNDTTLITDTRIVRMTYNILRFSESISEIKLSSIQEVNAEIPAFDPFAYLFQYGYIEIRTSGDAGNVKITLLPNPDAVQQLIMEDMQAMKQRQRVQQRQQTQQDVERWMQTGNQPNAVQGGFPNAPKRETLPTSPPFSPFVTSYMNAEGGMVIRKHWIVWARGVMLPVMLLVSALIVLIVGAVANVAAIGFGVAMVMFIAGGAWFWWADWDWRNDTMTVTDSTVILVHQRPLWLQNERDQVLLRQVDNIISETSGFFNRILSKGDVKMALVGSNTYKTFRDVQDPLRVQGEITRRQSQVKRQLVQQEAEDQRRAIGDYLTTYHHMVGAPRTQTPDAPPPPAPNSTLPQFRAGTPITNPPPRVARPNLTQGRLYQPNAIPPTVQPYTPPNPPLARPAPQPTPPRTPSVIAPPAPNSTRPPRLQGKKG